MADKEINTTLRFNADITDFKGAMQEANRAVKLANSQFKATSAGMDDWSDSTDGLTAKLDQLSAVEQAEKRKLEVLKTAYAKVCKEQGATSAAAVELETKINNQQAVVNKTSKQHEHFAQKLEEVENGASSATGDVKKVGKAAKEAGENAEDSAGGWTIVKDVIADMVKNTISWAIDSFKDLMTASSSSLSTLGARTGATTTEMQKYDKVMKDIYRNNYGESFDDIGDAMGVAIQQFGKLDDASLQNVTEQAITLRDTFDMDYNESMRAANSLMDQFGLTSEEAFNLIAQGAQQGLNQNGDLLDVVNEYAVQFRTAGYSADDMFNMLKNGADTGTWSVDKLGDAVKEFNIRAKDGTAAEGLKQYRKALGLSKKDVSRLSEQMAEGGETGQAAYNEILGALGGVKDETTRYQAGVALFGTMWEDLGEDAITALMDTEGGIKSTNKAMKKMQKVKYDNLADAFAGLGRIIKVDLIQPIADTLEPIAKGLVEWLIDNMETLKPIIVGVAAAISVFAAALAIQGVISGVQKAFALLNATLLANPIVLIVAAIAGLAAGLVYAYKKSETFRAIVDKVFAALKSGASTAVGWVTEKFSALASWFKKLPDKIKTAISGTTKKFVEWGSGIYKTASTWVRKTVSGVYSWFKQLPGRVWAAIKSTASRVVAWGSGIYKTASTWVRKTVSGVYSWFKQLPGRVWSAIKSTAGRVVSWGSGIYKTASTWVRKTVNGVYSWFKQLPGRVWSAISNTASRIVAWGTGVYNAASTWVRKTVSGIYTWFKQVPGKVYNAISGAIQKVVDWGTKLAQKGKLAAAKLLLAVTEKAKEIPGKLVEIGKNLVEGLWNGINDKVDWLKNKISSFVGNVTNWLKEFFGINSPSKETYWMGEMLVNGLVNAVNDGKKRVASAMRGLAGEGLDGMGEMNIGGDPNGARYGGRTIIVNQTNYSPRALSRREIYRQTHNAVKFAGGV